MTEWNEEKIDSKRQNSPESEGREQVPDSSEDVVNHKKIDGKGEKLEKMGGDNFEAEQARVLQELNKQKETIKGLLDEIQAAKKDRETHNIKVIFGK